MRGKETIWSFSRSEPTARRARRGVLVAAAVLAAAGCGDLFPPTHPYSTLEVEVVGTDGEPVADAGLVLYDWKREISYGQTRGDGRYVFRYVPEGEYGVMVGVPAGYRLPEGGQPHVHGIRLEDSSHESVSFVLVARRGAVRVVVLDEAGAPSSGVGMVLYSAGGRSWQGVTAADGSHTFDVPAGEYGVRPAAPAGYRSQPSHIDGLVVDEGSELEVTFSLVPTG